MKHVLRNLALTSALMAPTLGVGAAMADQPNGQPPTSTGTTTAGPTTSGGPSPATAGPAVENYQPQGIPLGGPFRLFPNLLSAMSFDDNALYAPAGPGKIQDFYGTINPTLILDYLTSSAKLDLYGDANSTQYLKLSRIDTLDFDSGLRGQYDFTRDAAVTGNLSYSELHESLSSANATGTDQRKPTQYFVLDATAHVIYQPSRFGLTAGGSYDSYTYLDSPLLGGGLLDNKVRDNDLAKGFVEASYTLTPNYAPFLRVIYDSDHYRITPDLSGDFRSSTGMQVDGGLKLLFTNVLQGSFFVGYIDQTYRAPLKDVNGVDFGADLFWYPADRVTVHLGAAHQLQNTILAGASVGDDRAVNLSAQYDIMPTLSVSALVGYDDTDYAHSALASPVEPSRDDRTVSLGVGAKWFINHYLWLSGNYTCADRTSTWIAPLAGSFRANMVTIALNVQE